MPRIRTEGGLTGTFNTATSGGGSGVWTMRDIERNLRTNTWPLDESDGVDTYFPYNVLLLHGDNSTNGKQNNTFIDSSSNAFTITRNGNSTQGSFSPYGSNWSNYFNGNGDLLTIPASTSLDMAGDFTVEAWIYRTASSLYEAIGGRWGTNNIWLLNLGGTGTQVWWQRNNTSSFTANYTFSLNTWYHIAVVRSGTTTTIYVNGTSIGSLAGDTYNYTHSTRTLLIARNGGSTDGTQDFEGNISNFRIVNGTAVYTSNFTPPTNPLTAITNTVVLTCQSNRFVDNSISNFTLTPTGTPSVQRYSPFRPSAAYSTATIGGSCYFDGTGDYLSIAANAAFLIGTNNFTIECWINISSVAVTRGIVTSHQTGGMFQFYVNTNRTLYAAVNNNGGTTTTYATASSTSTINLGTWNHVALVRNGTEVAFYINGVKDATTITLAANQNIGSYGGNKPIYIGAGADTAGPFVGYISDVRYVVGSAVYTSNFTPSSAPISTVAGTTLLCNFINAGIVDHAMINHIETIGNAQISTAQNKFGGSSIYFDGTDDRLVMPSSPNIAMASGDFTIEGWFYYSGSVPTGDRGFMQISDTAGGLKTSYTTGIIFYLTNSGTKLAANILGTSIIGATTISSGTWVHFAFTRQSGTCRLFVNGNVDASATQAGSMAGSHLCIGGYYSTLYLWNGYLDDIRITKGYARYTSGFTPPTTAFRDR